MPDPANKGGRPKNPEGEGTVAVSVRINEALLEQLRQLADEKWNGNLSKEINMRLRGSLRREREESRDPATRAFGFLIAELVEKIRCWPVKQQSWHKNPFLFRTFKLGVAELLTQLEPPGKMHPPPIDAYVKEYYRKREDPVGTFIKRSLTHLAKQWKSPSRAASYVAEQTLVDFFRKPGRDPRILFADVEKFDDETLAPIGEQYVKDTDRTWYGMGKDREDLKIDEATQKGEKP